MSLLISIVCPMYNESAGLDHYFKKITQHMDALGHPYELICVNDGSRDDTLALLQAKKAEIESLRIVNLSRNFGKENALSAGISVAEGDVVIPIDADLQDPPELIPEMLAKYHEGFDVVLPRRVSRKSDSLAKRWTAGMFYRLLKRLSKVQIPENVGDFRLMSRRVVNVLNNLPESQRFMKGLFAWCGFPTAYVDYERPERVAGESSFSGWKLWNLAWEGITSFSTVPLRIWTYLGVLVSSVSFLYGAWIIIRTLALGVDTPGYASTIVVVLFLGGIQLIGIGVIGEYIGRIYMESKRRPVFVIESVNDSVTGRATKTTEVTAQ
ncbi:glycosyltransferase family 2 protein [Microbulbifer sp. Q7]|uniref:glycosyltransferase family 2 protein n=1 Tax=Microbulbifer sp. Q7 TaxID=1785091 RepID=UPI000A7B199F|nr:glycosyltransferase family 2 protein [Microbulbifer sp. Q7]